MRIIRNLTLFVTLAFLWNCSDQGPAVETDESQILEAIESLEVSDTTDYFFDDLNDGDVSNFGDEPNFDDPYNFLKPIAPWRFGRIVNGFDRYKSVDMTSDSTATVHFDRIIYGHFVIVAHDSDSTSQVGSIYRKQLQHHTQRVTHFAKRNFPGYGNREKSKKRHWKLVDFSMAMGESEVENVQPTVSIKQLVIQSSNGDSISIEDPLNYFMSKDDLFTYPRGTEVTLTVTVENTNPTPVIFPANTQSTEFVRLHYGKNHRGHRGRRPFQWVGQDGDGNNIYQGTWTVAQRRGIHHAVIDVIDNGTIHDSDEDLYPYNSVTWSTPYRVVPF